MAIRARRFSGIELGKLNAISILTWMLVTVVVFTISKFDKIFEIELIFRREDLSETESLDRHWFRPWRGRRWIVTLCESCSSSSSRVRRQYYDVFYTTHRTKPYGYVVYYFCCPAKTRTYARTRVAHIITVLVSSPNNNNL